MKHRRRTLLSLATGVAIGLTLAIGQGVLADRQGAKEGLPLDALRTFSQVFAKVKSDYVEPIDDRTLIEYAISGMLANLDPHSAYLDPEAYKELQVGTSGEFGGLGIEVTMENGFVKVVSPIDDTPAQRAGIRAGDLIIRLDDTPVKGLTLRQAVEKMRGKPGTKITLTIIREGEEKPIVVTITRAVIKVKSVKSEMLEPGFGYVRITQFQAHTAENLVKTVGELKRQSGGHLQGLVLDLRNNPGGVLSGAVGVADAFLSEGLIVYTKGRVPDAELRFKATPGDVLDGAPLVVLINAGSASASEIVAGALQDHKRALIMGERSFGKGSVQTIIPLENGAALKLTTARYFTPAGRSIQAEGIEPDIYIPKVQVTAAEEEGVEPVKEADLARRLENPQGEPAPEEGQDEAQKAASLAARDYQLFEALSMLKGLALLGAGAGAAH